VSWYPFLLLIPFIFLAWFKPRWAALVLIAMLPSYLWRINLGGIPTTWLELGIYILFVILLAQGKYRGFFTKILDNYWSWLVPVLLLLVAATAGVVLSPDLRLALGIWKGWIIDPLILLSVLIVITKQQSNIWQWWRDIVGALLVNATLTSLIALFVDGAAGNSRLRGWYDSPNVLAMYLLPIFIISLMWWLDNRGRKLLSSFTKKIWLLACILLLVALLLTGSYAAWFSLFMTTVLVLGLIIIKSNAVKTSLGLLIIIASFLLPWFFTTSGWSLDKVSHINPTYKVTSGDVRLILWREATIMISDHPWWGVGLGGWQPLFDKTVRPALSEIKNPGFAIELHYASLFPHNLWLTVWLYLGVIGVVAFLWLGILIYAKAKLNFGLLGLIPLAAFSSILWQGAVDTPVFKNDLAIVFWLIILATTVLMHFKTDTVSKFHI